MRELGEDMDVKTAVEVLRAEGLRRHAILRERASVLAKADYARQAVGDSYMGNSEETKKVYGKLSRLSHALRVLSLFEGEI